MQGNDTTPCTTEAPVDREGPTPSTRTDAAHAGDPTGIEDEDATEEAGYGYGV